jgi:Family of unknown function (DUF6318)
MRRHGDAWISRFERSGPLVVHRAGLGVVRRRVRCHDSAVRTRFLAIGLIAGMLAACTSSKADPDPTPTPPVGTTASSSTVATSPSPSHTGPLTTGPNVRPGEKPPVFPALAKQHSADGALAFAAYYFHSFDWAYATNDATALMPLALPSCQGCKASIDALSQLRRTGETLTGGRVSILSARISHEHFNIRADFVADVELNEQAVVLHSRTAPASTVASGVRHHHALLFLQWASYRWQVADVRGK